MVDFRWVSGRQENLDHINAAGYVIPVKAAEPEGGRTADELALVFVDTAGRASPAGAERTFHLDEDKQISLAADEVELAAGTQPPAAAQHFVALSPQPRGSDQLAVFAYVAAARGGSVSPGAIPVVQQAQTCGDGES